MFLRYGAISRSASARTCTKSSSGVAAISTANSFSSSTVNRRSKSSSRGSLPLLLDLSPPARAANPLLPAPTLQSPFPRAPATLPVPASRHSRARTPQSAPLQIRDRAAIFLRRRAPTAASFMSSAAASTACEQYARLFTFFDFVGR